MPRKADPVKKARDDWNAVLQRDPCAYCGDAGGSVDHIAPRVLGGEDEPENLTGACLRCNGAKAHSADVLGEFERRRLTDRWEVRDGRPWSKRRAALEDEPVWRAA